MRSSREIALLIAVLLISAGLTLGLTYAPCYSSLCSEEFFPYETRLHIAFFYALLASLGLALYWRSISTTARGISEYHLCPKEVPILKNRISCGGLAATIWIVGLTLATTGFWLDATNFWAMRTDPINWVDGKIRLVVTCIIGHHIDILLGLTLIPVGRNSILGRVFALQTGTLLNAHKLLAYLLVVGAFAHGAAYYTFVGTYRVQSEDIKELFEIDNPTITQMEAESRGSWWFVNLPSGMLAFVLMLIIVITAFPILRRRSYNTFYYLHVTLSALIFILLGFHASTDFYFLVPGLILWISDWTWRLFRGLGGLQKRIVGRLENAGDGWYRISLPVSVKLASPNDDLESSLSEKRMPTHPLQSYFLILPTISKIQNHAFTAARVGNLTSGPTFLFQRTSGKKQKTLDKEWTWKLAASVQDSSSTAKDVDVRVEGPYIPHVPALFEASKIVCVVGGTGLTGAYSVALWWLKVRSQVDGTAFTLIWTIRHRSTANVREWQELEREVAGNARVRLIVQVTSEQGRLDINQVLRDELVFSSNPQGKDTQTDKKGSSFWVYISGPEGLLETGESACLNLQRELKKRTTNTRVDRLDYYSAKWEV